MCGRGRGRGRGDQKRELGRGFSGLKMEKEEEEAQEKRGDQLASVEIGNLSASSSISGEEEDEGYGVPRGMTSRRNQAADFESKPNRKMAEDLIKKTREREILRRSQIVGKVAPKIYNWQLRCEGQLNPPEEVFGRWKEMLASARQDQILREDLAKTRAKQVPGKVEQYQTTKK